MRKSFLPLTMAVAVHIEQEMRLPLNERVKSKELTAPCGREQSFVMASLSKGGACRCRDTASSRFPLLFIGAVAALVFFVHSCFSKIGRGGPRTRRLSRSRVLSLCSAKEGAESLDEEVDDFYPFNPGFSADDLHDPPELLQNHGSQLLFHSLRSAISAAESLVRRGAHSGSLADCAVPLLLYFTNTNAEVMKENALSQDLISEDVRRILRHRSQGLQLQLAVFSPVVLYARPEFQAIMDQVSERAEDFSQASVWTPEMQSRSDRQAVLFQKRPHWSTRVVLRRLQGFQRRLSTELAPMFKDSRNAQFAVEWPVLTQNGDPDLAAPVCALTHEARLCALPLALLNLLALSVSVASADSLLGEVPAVLGAAFALSAKCIAALEAWPSETFDKRFDGVAALLAQEAFAVVHSLNERRKAWASIEGLWRTPRLERINLTPASANIRRQLHFASAANAGLPASEEAAVEAISQLLLAVQTRAAWRGVAAEEKEGLGIKRKPEIAGPDRQRLVAGALYALRVAGELLERVLTRHRRRYFQEANEVLLLTIHFLADWIAFFPLGQGRAVDEPFQNALRMQPRVDGFRFELHVGGAIAPTKYSINEPTQQRLEAANKADALEDCTARVLKVLRCKVQRMAEAQATGAQTTAPGERLPAPFFE